MTTKQLAESLGLHPETIRRWVKSGKIPVIKIGEKDFRFDCQKVMEALGIED